MADLSCAAGVDDPSGSLAFDRDPVDGVTIEMPPPDLTRWVRTALAPDPVAPAASRLARRLTLLAQLSRAAAVGEGEESLYDRVLSLLLPELAPDTAVVFIMVHGEEKLRPHRFHRSVRMAADAPIKISSTVVSRVISDRVPFLASDAGATLAGSHSIRAQRIRSAMCVPLKAGERMLGLVYVDVRALPGFFVVEDLEFLATACAYLAVNLDNLAHLREVEQAYSKLERATRELMRAERLTALGRMSGLVSHELASPLQGATMAVDFLKRNLAGGPDAPGPKRAAEALELLQHSLERCHQLTQNLLHYSRKRGETVLAPVRLDEPMRHARQLMGVILSKRPIALAVRCPVNLPPVLGDAGELEQVFVNLLRNAADAISGEGRIDVEAVAEGASLRVTVRDSGAGIPPEHMPHVFEELYTTKPMGQGTGLGLPLCKQIVERHGGTISVESEPGRGTCVTLALPVVA